jgi:hypothetical protein
MGPGFDNVNKTRFGVRLLKVEKLSRYLFYLKKVIQVLKA